MKAYDEKRDEHLRQKMEANMKAREMGLAKKAAEEMAKEALAKAKQAAAKQQKGGKKQKSSA